MRYFSMFSGIGGFELGIERAYEEKSRTRKVAQTKRDMSDVGSGDFWWWRDKQPTCVGYSEIDKYAIQIYEKHFKSKNYGDCTKINWEEVEDFDLLAAGFPCQAFSVAGRRLGFEDTRGTLFFEIARCLKEKRPRYFLLENVKGLLSNKSGETFRAIVSTLAELGYDLQWQCVNSKNFGVPQSRPRVFIVGHIRGGRRPEVFPIRGSCEESNGKGPYAYTINSSDWRGPNRNQKQNLISYAIDANYYKGTSVQGFIEKKRRQLVIVTGNNKDRGLKEAEVVSALKGSNQTNPRSGGTSLIMNSGKAVGQIRRLTPVECERLQGFPDNWTKCGVEDGKEVLISDTQRYRCLGNAVTVNVVQHIFGEMLNG